LRLEDQCDEAGRALPIQSQACYQLEREQSSNQDNELQRIARLSKHPLCKKSV